MVYDTGLIVGRFQTFHKGHQSLVETALKLCDRVIIFVGSSQESGTERNPFNVATRMNVIRECYPDKDRVQIYALPDLTHENDTDGTYVKKESEIWKPIDGYEGLYEISNYGNVKSVERKVKCGYDKFRTVESRILIPYLINGGYHAVKLSKNGKREKKYVHRLVASAFCLNPCLLNIVNHKDGDRANNYFENLEWVETLTNNYYTLIMGWGDKWFVGKKNMKLNETFVDEIRVRYSNGESQSKLAKEYGVAQSAISQIVNFKKWQTTLKQKRKYLWGKFVLKNVDRYIYKTPEIMIYGNDEARSEWFDLNDIKDTAEFIIPRSRLPISATMLREMMVKDERKQWMEWVDPKLHKMYDSLRAELLSVPFYQDLQKKLMSENKEET